MSYVINMHHLTQFPFCVREGSVVWSINQRLLGYWGLSLIVTGSYPGYNRETLAFMFASVG